jgi:chemotaxis family two-component system response regulator Rcp1
MSNEIITSPIEILLVEDNPGDVRLIEETFKEGRLLNNLHVVENGVEAIDFLKHEGKYADAPRPELILLDLSLPRKGGLEVLAEIKSDGDLRRIPVVVLTTSKAEEDIIKSYDLNANSYVTKPVDLYQFIKILKSIGDFWLTAAKLPST